jgi:hypothetical protein
MAEIKKLPREVYKKIKQMDNVQLYGFIQGFYNEGRENMYNEIRGAIDFDELRSQIGSIRGIGAARLDEIMSVVETYITNSILEEDIESEKV